MQEAVRDSYLDLDIFLWAPRVTHPELFPKKPNYKCPSCNGTDTMPNRSKGALSLRLIHGMKRNFFLMGERVQCKDCTTRST